MEAHQQQNNPNNTTTHLNDNSNERNMATHLVKIKLDGDLRIMEIPSPPRFEGLVSAVVAAYGVPAGSEKELTFTYRDTDGDEVRKCEKRQSSTFRDRGGVAVGGLFLWPGRVMVELRRQVGFS